MSGSINVDWPYQTAPETTYKTDADFRALVDILEGYVHKKQFTPAELRAAATLAAIHYEMRFSRTYVFVQEREKDPVVENTNARNVQHSNPIDLKVAVLKAIPLHEPPRNITEVVLEVTKNDRTGYAVGAARAMIGYLIDIGDVKYDGRGNVQRACKGCDETKPCCCRL